MDPNRNGKRPQRETAPPHQGPYSYPRYPDQSLNRAPYHHTPYYDNGQYYEQGPYHAPPYYPGPEHYVGFAPQDDLDRPPTKRHRGADGTFHRATAPPPTSVHPPGYGPRYPGYYPPPDAFSQHHASAWGPPPPGPPHHAVWPGAQSHVMSYYGGPGGGRPPTHAPYVANTPQAGQRGSGNQNARRGRSQGQRPPVRAGSLLQAGAAAVPEAAPAGLSVSAVPALAADRGEYHEGGYDEGDEYYDDQDRVGHLVPNLDRGEQIWYPAVAVAQAIPANPDRAEAEPTMPLPTTELGKSRSVSKYNDASNQEAVSQSIRHSEFWHEAQNDPIFSAIGSDSRSMAVGEVQSDRGQAAISTVEKSVEREDGEVVADTMDDDWAMEVLDGISRVEEAETVRRAAAAAQSQTLAPIVEEEETAAAPATRTDAGHAMEGLESNETETLATGGHGAASSSGSKRQRDDDERASLPHTQARPAQSPARRYAVLGDRYSIPAAAVADPLRRSVSRAPSVPPPVFEVDNEQEEVLRRLGVTGAPDPVYDMPPPAHRSDRNRNRDRERSRSPRRSSSYRQSNNHRDTYRQREGPQYERASGVSPPPSNARGLRNGEESDFQPDPWGAPPFSYPPPPASNRGRGRGGGGGRSNQLHYAREGQPNVPPPPPGPAPPYAYGTYPYGRQSQNSADYDSRGTREHRGSHSSSAREDERRSSGGGLAMPDDESRDNHDNSSGSRAMAHSSSDDAKDTNKAKDTSKTSDKTLGDGMPVETEQERAERKRIQAETELPSDGRPRQRDDTEWRRRARAPRNPVQLAYQRRW